MDRRNFFRLPLAAVIGGTAVASTASAAPKFTTDAPKAGDIMTAPAGALEVIIEGKKYHLYVWETK